MVLVCAIPDDAHIRVVPETFHCVITRFPFMSSGSSVRRDFEAI